MSKQNTVQATGSHGRGDVLRFYPHELTLINSKTSPLYDPRVDMPLEADFAENIHENGVRSPVWVRRNGDEKQVVDGRQRVRAAAASNARRVKEGLPELIVPAILVRGNDPEIYKMIVEANEHRNETPPVMRAQQAQKMLDWGYSEEETRKSFRIQSVTGFKQLLALLDCDEKVQIEIDAGRFPATLAATELVKLPREKQVEEMARIVEGGFKGEVAKEMLRQRVVEHRAIVAEPAPAGVKVKPKAKAEPAETMPVAKRRTRRTVEAAIERVAAYAKDESVAFEEVDSAVVARAMAMWFLGSDRSFQKCPELGKIVRGVE